MTFASERSQALHLCFWHLRDEEQHSLFEVCADLNAILVGQGDLLWAIRLKRILHIDMLPLPPFVGCTWKLLCQICYADGGIMHYLGENWTKAASAIGVGMHYRTPFRYLWNINFAGHIQLSTRDRLQIAFAVLLSNTFEDEQAASLIYSSIGTRELFDMIVHHFRSQFVGSILFAYPFSIKYLPRLVHAIPKLTVRVRDINRAIIVAAGQQEITMLSKLLIHPFDDPKRYFAPALLELVKSNGRCMEKKVCIDIILNAQSKPLSCAQAIEQACGRDGWLIIARTLVCHRSVKLRRKTISMLIDKMGLEITRAWLQQKAK